MKSKDKTAAIVTVFRAPDMSTNGRRRIAEWLRRQASVLERNASKLARRYTARYIYYSR